jgi:hypothetical protein
MDIRDEEYSASKSNDVVEDYGLENLRFNLLEVFEEPIDCGVRDDTKYEVDHLFTVTVK